MGPLVEVSQFEIFSVGKATKAMIREIGEPAEKNTSDLVSEKG
jgi:hypothetical protein